ncbi:MAG: Crossover junction endodeoxyribonuclease RuvC [Bacteroidia bacterium]|nr:Crossover junction endodeoxyribonuclease RuvC [Bacteroidia bacterium]
MNERIILGIDPGTIVMGYGIICAKGNEAKLLTIGVLKLDKFEEHHERLKKIFERTTSLINEYQPGEMAIEAPFFGKNVQSMLKLGRAQGTAIAAALNKNIEVVEYSPRKIKQSITGNGSASKEQVAAMLKNIFKQKEFAGPLDATDGLAAATCHFFQTKNFSPNTSALVEGKKSRSVKTKKKNYSGWKSFLADNPGRVKKV